MCDTDLGRRARELLLLVYPYVRRTPYNGWIMERLDAAIATGEARALPAAETGEVETVEVPRETSGEGEG